MKIVKPKKIQYDVILSEEEYNSLNAAAEVLEELSQTMRSKECCYIHTEGDDMMYDIRDIEDVIEWLREYSTVISISDN